MRGQQLQGCYQTTLKRTAWNSLTVPAQGRRSTSCPPLRTACRFLG